MPPLKLRYELLLCGASHATARNVQCTDRSSQRRRLTAARHVKGAAATRDHPAESFICGGSGVPQASRSLPPMTDVVKSGRSASCAERPLPVCSSRTGPTGSSAGLLRSRPPPSSTPRTDLGKPASAGSSGSGRVENSADAHWPWAEWWSGWRLWVIVRHAYRIQAQSVGRVCSQELRSRVLCPTLSCSADRQRLRW